MASANETMDNQVKVRLLVRVSHGENRKTMAMNGIYQYCLCAPPRRKILGIALMEMADGAITPGRFTLIREIARRVASEKTRYGAMTFFSFDR